MEFKVFQKELELQSRGWIPTFHDVSKEIIDPLLLHFSQLTFLLTCFKKGLF